MDSVPPRVEVISDLTDSRILPHLRADESMASIAALSRNIKFVTGIGLLDNLNEGRGLGPSTFAEVTGESGSGKYMLLIRIVSKLLVTSEFQQSVRVFINRDLLSFNAFPLPSPRIVSRVVFFDLDFRLKAADLVYAIMADLLEILSSELPSHMCVEKLMEDPSEQSFLRNTISRYVDSCMSRLEVYRPRDSKELSYLLESLSGTAPAYIPPSLSGLGGVFPSHPKAPILLTVLSNFGSTFFFQAKASDGQAGSIGAAASHSSFSAFSEASQSPLQRLGQPLELPHPLLSPVAPINQPISPASGKGKIGPGGEGNSSTGALPRPMSLWELSKSVSAALSALAQAHGCRVVWTRSLLFNRVPSMLGTPTHAGLLSEAQVASEAAAERELRLLRLMGLQACCASFSSTYKAFPSSVDPTNDIEGQSPGSSGGTTRSTVKDSPVNEQSHQRLLFQDYLSYGSVVGGYLPPELANLVTTTILLTSSGSVGAPLRVESSGTAPHGSRAGPLVDDPGVPRGFARALSDIDGFSRTAAHTQPAFQPESVVDGKGRVLVLAEEATYSGIMRVWHKSKNSSTQYNSSAGSGNAILRGCTIHEGYFSFTNITAVKNII